MNRIPTSWMTDALHKSHLLFGLMIADVTQEQAQTLRDGPDGWSVVEIMCHVRDYQEIFFERIRTMAETQGEERPAIRMIDEKARQAMVEERDYAHQNLQAVHEDYLKTRAALLNYMHKLPPELGKTRLVIAGGKGWLDAPIYRTVRELKIEGRVVFTGFLEDELLPALYKTSRGLAFPSVYEGFGLPILEAMACGVPVMTSNVSSMVEVAGKATLLVNPLSIDEIREALVTLLTDEPVRAGLITAGFEQASHFTWPRAAAELHAIYQDLLGTSR